MAGELERKLERLLREPRSSAEVEERALAQALAALPEEPPARRLPLRSVVFAAAAAAMVLAVTAGALAGVGALHVSLGQPAPRRPTVVVSPVPRLELPAGAHGLIAVVDGRLWLTTRNGVRIEGLPVFSATLSPRALYVAAGIGDSLVAMAPDGTRAWSQPTGGRVVAIAWAPNGLRIAYVVRRDGRFQLRTIEGNGAHDRLLDDSVRPVAPSWRADSLAVAYVGAGGRAVVYDFGHARHRRLAGEPKRATGVAFAPAGSVLAVTSEHGFWLRSDRRASGVDFAGATVADAAWLNGRLAVALNPSEAQDGGPRLQLYRPGSDGEAVPAGRLLVPAAIRRVAVADGQIAIAVRTGTRRLRLLASTGAKTRAERQPPQAQLLLEAPTGASIGALALR